MSVDLDDATPPVLLHHGWVLLADDGTHTPTKEPQ